MLHNVAKSWSLDQHYWIIQRTSCNEMIFFFFITIISCLTCIVNLSLLKYIWGKSEVWLSRSGDDIGDENYTEEDNDAVCKPYYPCSPRDFPSRAAVFSAGGHLSPWVSMLLLLGGDIETNPGPPTYICRLCKQIINKRQTSIQCNSKSKHWIHLKCSGTRLKDYNSSFLCNLHSNQDSTTDTDQSSDNDHSTTSTSTSPASSSSHSRTQSSNFDSLPLTDSHNQSATDSSLSSSPISPLSSTPKSSHSSSPDSSHSSSPKSSSDNDSTSRLTPPRPKNLKILQININGLRNKTTELNLLVKSTKPEIITVQETKLNSKLKTPDIPNYSSIRKDRTTDGGGGLMTYIHHSITFTEITTPNNNNQIETIVTKLDTTPPFISPIVTFHPEPIQPSSTIKTTLPYSINFSTSPTISSQETSTLIIIHGTPRQMTIEASPSTISLTTRPILSSMTISPPDYPPKPTCNDNSQLHLTWLSSQLTWLKTPHGQPYSNSHQTTSLSSPPLS